MGLTDCQKNLIKSVAENDIRSAKKWAFNSLEEDKTQKNVHFVNRYRQILSSESSSAIELPANLRDILVAEDVSLSFQEGRYYLADAEKQLFLEITKMSKVSQELTKLNIPYLNSTLLYGLPGTGKTMFGRYVAYKMQLPFVYINFSRIVDSYMGATSRNIAQGFTYAASNPCVFMLDEVDAISCNRESIDNSSASKESSRMTITLMQELDKLPNDVTLIAATNRIDLLDKAFISRCSLKHEIKPFDKAEKTSMINKFTRDVFTESEISLTHEVIEEIADTSSTQRDVMQKLIRAISKEIIKELEK